MAISLTQVELSSAIRLGDSAEEVAEATRLLAFATEAISRHLGNAYADAPETIVNEAAIRLAGYFYDQPNAGRGLSFANAGRNSGAWAILLPFRVHRAGTTGDAVAAAQEAVGLTGNPVVGVALTTDELIVSFADGTVETTPFTPGSGGGGIDQPARDAAAAAQSEIAAHELSPHNTDAVARSTAVNARQIGEAAQATADAVRTELATHETTPHGGGGGTDQMARAAAAAAQGEIDAHEASTHNHDATARAAAATAQGTADTAQAEIDAHKASTHNHDATARAAAATAQGTADNAATAATANADQLVPPSPTEAANGTATTIRGWSAKLIRTAARAILPGRDEVVDVENGRLPGLSVVMRLGWSQSRAFTESHFDRPLPPIGGSVTGASDGLAAPPFPPALASDPTLFLGIWLAGDPDIAELPAGFAVADKRAITVDGTAGVYFVSTARLPASVAGDVFKVFLVGERIVTESDLAAHVSDPVAHHVPPTGSMGGGPTVLYEATAAIGTSTGLIAGNVTFPETGALEFYFEGLTGTRQGAVAYARIPVARIRGAVSALNIAYSNNSATLLAIPHGANRGVGVAVQATTSFLMLSAQAPGDFYIRVAHTG